MLINSTHRLRIPSPPKPIALFLFLCCLTTALLGQTAPPPVLQNPQILNVKSVSQINSFCGKAFFKRLFIQGQSTAGYQIVPASNGNFFIAASVGERTMMALADRKMEVIWAKSVDMGLGAEFVLDMRLDSEGNIIGVGNTSLLPVECFAFKMNAADGQLLWRSRLNDPGNSYFTRILEKNNGANYLLFGQTDLVGTTGTGCDALLMEINRNTGELLWDRQYDLGSCEIVNDVFIENNQIYVCGRYNLVDGGQSRFRAALSLFDTAGNLQWSRHYVRDNDQDATMYFNALTLENDSLVAFGWGNDAGTNLMATTLQLVKTDLTGVASWAKKYDIVGGNEERATKLFSLSDGYLLFGAFFSPTASREICLLKTDKQGDLLWGKSYGGLGEDRLSDAILVSDTIYLIGSRQNGSIFDILIGKVDLNGEVDSQCGFVKNLDVTVSDYAAPLDFTHNLEELDITHNYATAALPAQTTENNVVTEVICQKICDPPCDTVKLSQTFEFCPGGWATIGGNIYTQPGTVFDTIPGTGTDCDTVVTHTLILLPSPTRSETLSLCPGESVTIGGNVYFAPATVVDTIWPTTTCTSCCDTLVTYTLILLTNPVRSETIEFCPGDSVLIGGIYYTQPGTVVDTIPGTGTDCDTVVTYTLVLDISFLKLLGRDDSDEAALGVYDAKDGNLYVTGVVGGDSLVIIKMTPAGDILWSDRIDFIDGRVEYIAEMFVDDEGMLAGAGTFSNIQNGFAFRYDPVAHTLLWSKRIALADCQVLGILQKPNTGNYRIYLNFPIPFVNGSRITQWDISKTTGSTVLMTAAHYLVDTADVINNMVLYQDKIYACGGYTFQGYNMGGRRHALTRFDLDGNVEWSRLGPADQNTVQRLTGNDLIIDNQHIISIFSGDDDGTSLDNTTIFLQKNTLDGDLIWIRKFDLGAGFSNEIAEEVVSVADGYVLMGRNRTGPGDLFFLKTDKEGHLQWAKRLDIANDNFAGLGRDQSQLMVFNNGLYFAAMTQNVATGKSDMLFGRMNLKGEIGAGCGFIQPLDVLETSIDSAQNIPVTLIRLGQGTAWADFATLPVPAPTSLPVNTACSGCEPPGCDTVQIAQSVEFCPGDIVQIGGEDYTQPGTVFDTIPGTGTDCDTVVTYTLQFFQNSVVQMQCPANIIVEAASGANSATVNYNLPTANTDCICGGATVELQQGQPSGSNFALGATQVCYEASDDCGGANACCFTVTVQAAPPEEACDVKITPCAKFEILGIFQNPAGRKTYRMRVTNTCANNLIYVAFQLPNGMTAYSPATNTTYTAPSGRQYEVRNPNYSPTYSIRFKAIGNGIANGQSDVFEYTLPPQADPLYIYAIVRLYPKVFYETHLNVFDCEVQQIPSRPTGDVNDRQTVPNTTPEDFAVFPNPASNVLFVQMPPTWSAQRVQLRVTDAYGRQLFHQTATAEANLLTLELPTDWPTGIYYLEAINEQGERQTGRFVRAVQR